MSSTDQLYIIQEDIRTRVEDIVSAHGAWPCRKGCDDCCRSLASVPIVSGQEWELIATELARLEPATREAICERIRGSAHASRPVVCPMLNRDSGTCLVYDARPVACRSYGFYVERESVLGCHRIERVAKDSPGVVWGNGTALEAKLQSLGPAAELYTWLDT